MNMKSLSLLVGAATLLAILPWPYSYYQALRLVVFTTSIILGFNFYKLRYNATAVLFGLVALLFNPISPIYLSRSVWLWIDLIVGALLIVGGLSLSEKLKK